MYTLIWESYITSRGVPGSSEGVAIGRVAQAEPALGAAGPGKAWALKGESEKAIGAYERALRYDGTQYDLHYRLFDLYRKTGQAGLAQNHLAAFEAGEAKKQASYREGVAALESEPSSH
jgi:tetratricopeptide (TPR) repeat protein